MNILHITINPIALERRILNQAHTTNEKTGKVTIIALKSAKFPAHAVKLNGRLIEIKTIFDRGGPLKFLIYNFKVWLTARRSAIGLIHAHDLWILPAAAILARSKKVPLVYDAHEYYGGLEIFTRRKIRKFIWLETEKWCISAIKHLITVSEPLAVLYRDHYRPKCPVSVIRNLPAYEQPDPERAFALKKNKSEKLLLFHGHFRPGRGLLQLVEAMKTLPDCRLALIGGGDLENPLREICHTEGLSERVDFYDYIQTDQLVSTAAQADIGLALFEPTSENYAHALPNKFFEYLMAGVPVLASNIDTFTSYVKKYDIGRIVDPNDIEAIVKVIQEMLTDPVRLERWHKNTLSAARELNWDNEAGKLLSIYENLARI